MTDYSELVKALRETDSSDWKRLSLDAAAAIEDLQARVSKLEERTKAQQERLEDYMEKQLIIDRWGAKWMTSAKDVPTAAYEHGYADGRDEAEAQLLKLGEWKPFDLTYGRSIYSCSVCEQATEVPMCMEKPMYAYCPNCGAKMEVQE